MPNTCLCYCLGCFAGTMGDFTWRPLAKQVGLIGATLPPSVAAPFIGENGQPAREVGPAAVAVEVTPTLLLLF